MTITPSNTDLLDVRAEIAAVLGVETDSLDPGSDLVMHGLDSLRMMKLAGQWRKRGYDVDFARLVADPTIEAWTDLLGDAAVSGEDDNNNDNDNDVNADADGEADVVGDRRLPRLGRGQFAADHQLGELAGGHLRR